MKVIAIDPGFERLGIAIVERNIRGKESVLYSTCVETSRTSTFEQRLLVVGVAVAECIKKNKPEALAIEALYFAANQKTAIAVAGARGVVLYEAARAQLPVYEYTPMQIKVAVTGYGKATKDDVAKMVKKLVLLTPPTDGKKRIDDELDAIAIGLCALASIRIQ